MNDRLSSIRNSYIEKNLDSFRYKHLCEKCLNQIEEAFAFYESHQSGKGLKGVHYYIEEGKYVFTEVQHLQRGSCCKSGCRHCPYGGYLENDINLNSKDN